MKKLLLLAILTTLFFNSCRKDNDPPADPCDISYSSTKITLGYYVDFRPFYAGTDPNGPGGAAANDLFIDLLHIQAKNGAMIEDVGGINCLGLIPKTSNFNSVSKEISINHGYIVRLNDGTYARFIFVESIILNNVQGFQMIYQYPYSNY